MNSNQQQQQIIVHLIIGHKYHTLIAPKKQNESCLTTEKKDRNSTTFVNELNCEKKSIIKIIRYWSLKFKLKLVTYGVVTIGQNNKCSL
ncbi:hypothetical protein DERP_012331 [Dermatophagoides pteronyssinus]|uniref:Uncharacterized protein n=1 Tax=Dermatophagoides pteronyssinus TaxID=6956 RepID=A0ABQ8JQI8_DERPT|nr:hypothetical protein DERP_012331 [Dermatophagoides pteronyssinus]